MADEKTTYPSDAADKFLLRLPDGMREKLKAAAKEANRTMNAEIVARLTVSFEGGDGQQHASLAPVLARLERDLARWEFEAESGRFRTGFVAEPLAALTRELPREARLPGNPADMTAGQWHDFAIEMIKQAKGAVDRLYALVDDIKKHELAVRANFPGVEAEPGTFGIPNFDPQVASPADLDDLRRNSQTGAIDDAANGPEVATGAPLNVSRAKKQVLVGTLGTDNPLDFGGRSKPIPNPTPRGPLPRNRKP